MFFFKELCKKKYICIGWKVLLTSRNEAVTTGILQKDLTCFKVDCLTPQESWTLFRRIAFPKENTNGKIWILELVFASFVDHNQSLSVYFPLIISLQQLYSLRTFMYFDILMMLCRCQC